MALLSSSSSPISSPLLCNSHRSHSSLNCRNRGLFRSLITSQLCTQETLTLDRSSLDVAEAISEEELWAAACLRVQSFYKFEDSFGIEDHKRFLAEREFEALKERIAGKRLGFGRVSCINATLPLSHRSGFSDDLLSACKFSENGEDRVVVGTLDLNQCIRLPDEITGKKPEGIGADFARAYLSNVCVAKELHRNGVAHALVAKSKKVAKEWGNNLFNTSSIHPYLQYHYHSHCWHDQTLSACSDFQKRYLLSTFKSLAALDLPVDQVSLFG
ncbi:hypothetical protein HHK36_013737 [Tetracentron sinense]|uniref:N-acetyltransferase domain-containing protein n=1 Tax=Tetracentron sinense TaxID=13715 RepID=A0A834Z3T5_TETSI|nr:hypothetical protein HHK36_013737 [Tetracentron sinense]